MKNLKELSHNEMRKVEGGGWPVALAIALLISAIDNFGDIREGWSDGGKGTPRY